MKKIIKGFSLAVFVWMGSRSAALSYTATDYNNAGLQLYNSKSYDQAIQYFSAALSLDPNNTTALQGRANCYYSQGQYSQALADYQKVQALNPSDAQLSQFVQALQAKVGSAPRPGRPPRLPAARWSREWPCTNNSNTKPPYHISNRRSVIIPITPTLIITSAWPR